MLVLHYHSSFEEKKLQGITTSYFISCCFTSAFTSEDIIFYNFLELDSKLSKKDFCHKFYFNSCTQTPHSLNDQNPLSVMKVFCWCSLKQLASSVKLGTAFWNFYWKLYITLFSTPILRMHVKFGDKTLTHWTKYKHYKKKQFKYSNLVLIYKLYDVEELYKNNKILRISDYIKFLNCLFVKGILTNLSIPPFQNYFIKSKNLH